jgi:molecular chaperone GrpE
MDSKKKKEEKDTTRIDNKEKYIKMKKNDLVELLGQQDDELKILESKLNKAKKELVQKEENINYYKEQLIRMQADFENFKKREEKKKKDFLEYANKDLICRLLSVVDNLERAASYSKNEESHSESIREGIKGILKEFRKILEQEGVSPIKAVGEKFDPYCHEAIMQVESEKYPEDTITEEITKGYYLKSQVIRPSVVKVCKGQSDENKISEDNDIEKSSNNNKKNKNNEE